MLTSFEHIEDLTQKERDQLDWMLIELQARHALGNEWNRVQIRQHSAARMQKRGGDWEDYKGLSGVQVRKMIQCLRDNDHPIGSNGKGYYFCYRPSDWHDTIAHLSERVKRGQKTLDKCQEMQRAMAVDHKTIEMFKKGNKRDLPKGTKFTIRKPASTYDGLRGEILFSRSDGGYTVKIYTPANKNDIRQKEFIIPQLLERFIEVDGSEIE